MNEYVVFAQRGEESPLMPFIHGQNGRDSLFTKGKPAAEFATTLGSWRWQAAIHARKENGMFARLRLTTPLEIKKVLALRCRMLSWVLYERAAKLAGNKINATTFKHRTSEGQDLARR